MIILLDGPFDHFDIVFTLSESKSLASLKSTDEIRQATLDSGFRMDQKGWKTARRATTSSNKKKFETVQKNFFNNIVAKTKEWQAGGISKTRWVESVRAMLREAYQKAFELGLKSSGAETVRATIADSDKKWVKTASKHEMLFLNRLLVQIEEGKIRGGLEKRLKAYSDALKNVFFSGRVQGTPSGHLIDWTGPNDRATCNGCRFLIEHSPYTKSTLPTTPRAGDTRCLNNCRCRLIVRETEPGWFRHIEESHKSPRWYKSKLSRLKAGKTL